MKVVTQYTKIGDWEVGFSLFVNGVERLNFRDGEIEQICRGYSDCNKIDELMRDAYEAGKRGEPFTVQELGTWDRPQGKYVYTWKVTYRRDEDNTEQSTLMPIESGDIEEVAKEALRKFGADNTIMGLQRIV